VGPARPAPPRAPAARPAATRATGAFYRHCAACHLSDDRTPPNFLQGDAARVERQLAHCAERLAVRLAMWRSAPEARAKTPMPPPPALRREGFEDVAAWRDGAELTQLDAYVADRLREQTGHGEALAQLLARDYESLRPCLPSPVP
jgi:mono/diheme cytochrome c family protein